MARAEPRPRRPATVAVRIAVRPTRRPVPVAFTLAAPAHLSAVSPATSGVRLTGASRRTKRAATSGIGTRGCLRPARPTSAFLPRTPRPTPTPHPTPRHPRPPTLRSAVRSISFPPAARPWRRPRRAIRLLRSLRLLVFVQLARREGPVRLRRLAHGLSNARAGRERRLPSQPRRRYRRPRRRPLRNQRQTAAVGTNRAVRARHRIDAALAAGHDAGRTHDRRRSAVGARRAAVGGGAARAKDHAALA